MNAIDPNATAKITALPAACCGTCRFYFMPGQSCRRMPPQIIVTGKAKTGGVNYSSHFPPMAVDGWCGEWSAVMQ